MKIFYSLLFILINCSFYSCKKDDDSKEQELTNWTVTLEVECGVEGAQFLVCISPEEMNRVEDEIDENENCNWVTVTAINDETYSGFWRDAHTSSNYCVY